VYGASNAPGERRTGYQSYSQMLSVSDITSLFGPFHADMRILAFHLTAEDREIDIVVREKAFATEKLSDKQITWQVR
jgi:hypothetical protein